MEEMHNKMMQAKSPEERKAMMAEHMKTMQDSMKMMDGTSGMGGMPEMKDKMSAETTSHHRMMEKRMDVMEMMIRMMMDRLSAH